MVGCTIYQWSFAPTHTGMAKKCTYGYKSKVRNQEPIVTQRGVNREPPLDMYFKGARENRGLWFRWKPRAGIEG
jgi:hypothetical protein